MSRRSHVSDDSGASLLFSEAIRFVKFHSVSLGVFYDLSTFYLQFLVLLLSCANIFAAVTLLHTQKSLKYQKKPPLRS